MFNSKSIKIKINISKTNLQNLGNFVAVGSSKVSRHIPFLLLLVCIF